MAEAAGLTVGVMALAGLFNNSIQCFEYVELGRTFGRNFQTCQLKLDSARLRLSRWGRSLGLSDDLQGAKSLEQDVGPQAIEQANGLLGQVLELFAGAEGISVKYQKRTTGDDGRLAICSIPADMDSTGESLHAKMRQFALTRQNQSSLRQKAKWALYEEKTFRRLIEDIAELVTNLTDLFPANQATQLSLCDEEIATLGSDDQSKRLLKEVVAEHDAFLEAAISKATKNAAGIHNIVFSGSHNSGFQLAHNSGTISGINFGKPTKETKE